jgi:hypothetical protein
MEGEDILIGYIRNKELFLQDYSANRPVNHYNDVNLGGRDDVLQSSGSEDNTFTVIEFRRKRVSIGFYRSSFGASAFCNDSTPTATLIESDKEM